MFRFVHAADLHLDSPFKGITGTAGTVAETLRAASFQAFDALLNLCRTQNAAFLLVAGDVYDGADRSLRAQLRFRDGLAALAADGIQSFIVHGNHDPLDGWTSAIAWPPGVHIFGADHVETTLAHAGPHSLAAISGVSYRTRTERRALSRQYEPTRPDLFQIALLHCNCGRDTGHDDYVPCLPADLAALGFDYWALGHVHTRDVISTNPPIVYPGNTQGRSVREPGPRGCYVVTVHDDRHVELEFHPLHAVLWLADDVSIDDLTTIDALDRALAERTDQLRARGDTRPVVARLTLTGRGPLHHELLREGAVTELLTRAREVGLADTPFVWVQDLHVATRPTADLEALRAAPDILGSALRIAQELATAPDVNAALAPTLADLHADPRLRKLLDPLSPDALRALLTDAELLCVDLLAEKE